MRAPERFSRRAVLLASGAWLALGTAPAFAQTGKSARRVIFLHPGSETGYRFFMDAFRGGLKDLGYVEGRNIVIDVRWGNDRMERLPAVAAEVVAAKPDVIVTVTSAAIAALKKATTSIPIVFATAAEPEEQGFVASLRRPGGNITGITVYANLTDKLVEIAREALPSARRLGILLHEADPFHKRVLHGFEQIARRFQFESIVVLTAGSEDFDRAFGELAKRRADAVLIPQLALFTSRRAELAARGLQMRLPLLSNSHLVAESGGLLSYGTLSEENYRRAAALVDKILRGAKPGDLPVEQPERFQLVVNMKTAKAIGVTLSRVTMMRADRVIE